MEKLRHAWNTWKRIAQFIGDWIARVVLTIFYFTLFAPFGLGVRLFSDPLKIKRGLPGWRERATRALSFQDARRLF